MKKIIILMFVALISGVFTVVDAATLEEICKKSAEAIGINTKDPSYNTVWRPGFIQYHCKNYLGALSVFQKRLRENDNDPIARYYLALCYHNMGYKEEAQIEYMKVIEADSNPKLVFYSKKAMACLDDPKSELCTGKMPAPELTDVERAQQERIKQLEAQIKDMDSHMHPVQNVQAEDDITKFIKSNQKIHPAAMDRITTERMERKLQEAEYKRKQEEANKIQ